MHDLGLSQQIISNTKYYKKNIEQIISNTKYYKKNIGSLNGQIRVLAFGKAQTLIGFYCCLFTNKLLYELFVGNIVEL